MSILILAEHDNSTLAVATAKAIAAAQEIGGDIDVLVAGSGCGAVADAAAKLDGVAKVLLADADAYGHQLAEPVSELLVHLAGNYSHIVAAATTSGKNVMPRVAALLDVMQVSDITAVVSPKSFERPVYAGAAIQTVEATADKIVVTVRASAFDAVGDGGSAPVEAVDFAPSAPKVKFVSRDTPVSAGPELANARIVVSGGRALGSEEKFNEIIKPLADKLGAAMGASRAAVDAGYAPNDWQVGQTGKVVAPDLYIAVGISGAIQHLAGMKNSKIIVAIDKDPEAPIFSVADYGLVGDLFELVPELTSSL
ncbi:electron transfer flavoprotein subunit alpha/FixB family protein [Pelagibacterium halotolerans]|uniref:Electron transfer flavoprotein subunit alpha n=1 Tax=Pelagibacterium halotolerans (strain DSM 22347 / JCM 15775 / CGMCC 1.7692 / B2) TaxID=1082931 RepID=G4R5Z3_PELHB|nr:FAD-binding protein [Pelagibacterium halotolerans]AEQ51108.1 electron transfer flavoprotein, alpha subunit [Pelagibacterium halotolerans B2]QJR19012.1 electron transfer flavoprotein subunit alpha [Pelagibacterium halotolerans]SEA70535.1 electron transfer flavoprotein alpha subunit apoprotein [Pelagibacterium halotolerans]